MTKRRRPFLRLLCAIVAAPAAAQQSAAPPQDDIVVVARENALIDSFVQNLTDPTRGDQVARWDTPLCSGIVGLPGRQAAIVNTRIDEAAQAVRLPTAKAGCRPNALVIVTPDPTRIAALMRKRYPITLGREGRARLRAFAETTRPVRWISQTRETPFDGSPGIPGFGNEPAVGRQSSSRLQASTRTVLSTMIVLVDAGRVSRFNLGQLGDYLAMVLLARPKPDAPAPAGSILALFDAPDAAALSDGDRSYLRALYTAPASVAAKTQRAATREAMKKR